MQQSTGRTATSAGRWASRRLHILETPLAAGSPPKAGQLGRTLNHSPVILDTLRMRTTIATNASAKLLPSKFEFFLPPFVLSRGLPLASSASSASDGCAALLQLSPAETLSPAKSCTALSLGQVLPLRRTCLCSLRTCPFWHFALVVSAKSCWPKE